MYSHTKVNGSKWLWVCLLVYCLQYGHVQILSNYRVSHGATFQTPWQQPEMPARNVAFSERGTTGGMNNCLLYRKRLGVYRNLLINWIRPRGFRLSLILTWSSIFILIFKPTQTTYSWYNPSKTSNPLNIPLFFYFFFSLSVSSKGKFKSGNVPLCCLKRNPC